MILAVWLCVIVIEKQAVALYNDYQFDSPLYILVSAVSIVQGVGTYTCGMMCIYTVHIHIYIYIGIYIYTYIYIYIYV